MRHYSQDFVAKGGHRAVAEQLNAGACGALRRVVSHMTPETPERTADGILCIPLFVYAHKASVDGAWELTSTSSGGAFTRDAKRLIRKRALREALLAHAAADVDRVHSVLGGRLPNLVVIRLVIVFADESSHVNVVVIRRRAAEHFEPKMMTRDTAAAPFATVRSELRRMLEEHGIRVHAPPTFTRTLQTTDDLCQTWVAAYVLECVRRPQMNAHDILKRLRPCETCDSLCALLLLSEEIFRTVPFPEVTRRGTRFRTLADRSATTSRNFYARPGRCAKPV